MSRVVGILNVQPGDVVADVGAGTGMFFLPMAEASGAEDLVNIVDINRDLRAHVDELIRSGGIHNIRAALGGEEDPADS